MRHFKVFHTVLLANVDPFLQFFEVKGILTLVYRDVHQLGGQSFTASLGIQRRGKNGCQNHIDAMLRRHFQITFQGLPVGGRKHGLIIKSGNAVTMEPLGNNQILLGQCGGNHVEGKNFFHMDVQCGIIKN